MNPFSTTVIDRAVAELSWRGDVVGPVEFAGARFLAVARTHGPPRRTVPPPLHLEGVLFAGSADSRLLQEASLLAAYAPRAVLVPDRTDLTGFLVDASVLDQGVVVAGVAGTRLLAAAGPRVYGGPPTADEEELVERVRAAWWHRLAPVRV